MKHEQKRKKERGIVADKSDRQSKSDRENGKRSDKSRKRGLFCNEHIGDAAVGAGKAYPEGKFFAGHEFIYDAVHKLMEHKIYKHRQKESERKQQISAEINLVYGKSEAAESQKIQ